MQDEWRSRSGASLHHHRRTVPKKGFQQRKRKRARAKPLDQDLPGTAQAPDHGLETTEQAALVRVAMEELSELTRMVFHLRVTEDLRAIQRQLNCAAMEAPSDPELMEALSQLPEMDALQLLKSALDQMRHFLWFYMQVMTNESETGERLRQSIRQKASADAILSPEASFLEKFKTASDAALLRYLSDGKNRKPN